MKKVVLLGSTGSSGTSTVKVAEDLPEHLQLIALGAGNNADLLLAQSRKHRPLAVSIGSEAKAIQLREALGGATQVYSGVTGCHGLCRIVPIVFPLDYRASSWVDLIDSCFGWPHSCDLTL